MLKLILGRIGSGKTMRTREIIKDKIKSGNKVMLIVPEQYSFQTEKSIVEEFGSKQADCVEVLSFSFLALEILKKYGVNSAKILDDGTRALMMSIALEAVSEKLNVFGRHRYSTSIIAEMLKTVKEFRQCSVSSDIIRETAQKVSNDLLKAKLNEVSIIMDAYTTITERSYFDDECALDKLYDLLSDCDDIKDKTVIIDGFRGFTSQELKVIGKIMTLSQDTYITLCADRKIIDDDYNALAHTKRTRQKLIRLAEENSVKISVPEYIETYNQKRYTNDELPVLESGLYSDNFETYDKATEHITICSAEDFGKECEYVAHTVKKLLRTQNLRCRDIAIISRSETNYTREIHSALKKNGVPVFEDRRQPISSQPLIEFVLSCVDIAVNGFSVDSVMRVLKSGLTDITDDEIAELENYALLWQINGNKWLDEWKGHPDGLGEKMTDSSQTRLNTINLIRVKVVSPLQKMRVKFKNINGLSASECIYKLLREMNVAENLKKLAVRLNDSGETELAMEQNRIWEIVIEILDRIASSLGEINLTAKRFFDLLNLIISTYNIGTLPQGLDEIVIGSADRVKTTAPKIVFAVGVNDGVFPMIPSYGGILSDNDRKQLEDTDLQIDDNYEQKMMEEHFIAYNTLCSASDRLYVTYPRKNISGEDMSESEIILQIKSIFPNVTVVDTICTADIDFVESDISAFELMARLTAKGGKTYDTLRQYFKSKPEFTGRIKALERAANREKFEITDKSLAKELFGMNMYMSASRTEVYNKCPFEYFCKYGLNANPRKVAELDPMQKGTAIHYILENLISTYSSDGLCAMTKEERDECVKNLLEEYFKDILTLDNDMGDRFNFLYKQLVYIICEVVDRLVSEFSVSEFVPVAFELKIDNDGEVPTYDINLPDGGVLKLKGSVDRVDIMKCSEDTFVRVVDYKSGGKKFDLNEVFSGLNMQMLIYLFAIWKSGFREYKNIKPAGVLYMPVNAPYIKSERNGEESDIQSQKMKSAKMNGMVLDDSRVVYGMDNRADGDFIPAKINKSNICTGNVLPLKEFDLLMKRVEKVLENMAMELHAGNIEVNPAVAESTTSPYYDVCKYCDYMGVCCKDEDTPTRTIKNIKFNESVLILGGEDDA